MNNFFILLLLQASKTFLVPSTFVVINSFVKLNELSTWLSAAACMNKSVFFEYFSRAL